jgi:ATP-dependent Zn protease
MAELEEIVEFLKIKPNLLAWVGNDLGDSFSLGHPIPARRCWPRQWPGKRVCPSSSHRGVNLKKSYIGVGARRVRELFDAAQKKGTDHCRY